MTELDTTVRITPEVRERLGEEKEQRSNCSSKNDVIRQLLEESSGKQPVLVWE